MRPAAALAKLNMQSWPEHLLTLVNSTAAITGIIGAALVLVSLGLLYFSNAEISRRASDQDLSPEEREARRARSVQNEKAIAAFRKSEKEMSSRLTKTEGELLKARRSEEAKSLRLAQTEADLAAANKAARDQAARAAKAEAQLTEIRRGEEARSLRLNQTETDLAAAKNSGKEQAEQLAKTEVELGRLRASDEAKSQRVTQTEADLAAAQKSNKEQAMRVAELEAQLAEIRRSEQEKSSLLSQVESDYAGTQKSEQDKAQRLAQLEAELAKARQSDEAKTVRVTQLEKDIAAAQRVIQENADRIAKMDAELTRTRQAAEEAKAVAGKLEAEQKPRAITPEQRLTFLEAVRGQSRGPVIVSAIFFNSETHEFGKQITKLLTDAGFTLLEDEPLNFFTTGRPPSGVRIGFKSESNEPAHVATLLKGFRAIGLDPPRTTLVNSDSDDVVEIQVTPRP